MTPDRIRLKATAYTMAWARIFGTEPSLHNVMLGLAPALFETAAGDSWKGPDGLLDTEDDPNNWGATTLRPLNSAELAAVAAAGIKPTLGPDRDKRARDAEAAIRAAGLSLPRGEIHCDSRPTKKGTVVYGFALSNEDLTLTEYASLVHGKDERVSCKSLELSYHYFSSLPDIFYRKVRIEQE